MGFGPDGQPLTTNLADYLLVTATEMPPMQFSHRELPTPLNPLGVKGVGESGVIPLPAAIASAVEDALSPFEFRIRNIPIKPDALYAPAKPTRDVAPLIPAKAGIQILALGPRFRGDERNSALSFLASWPGMTNGCASCSARLLGRAHLRKSLNASSRRFSASSRIGRGVAKLMRSQVAPPGPNCSPGLTKMRACLTLAATSSGVGRF